MKNIKTFTVLLGIICIVLLIILFMLLKEKKNNFNLEAYNELFNTMSSNVKYRLLNEYVGGGFDGEYWKEEVDSMYFHLDKLMYSNSYYDYCDSIYLFTVDERKRINSILKSLNKYDTKEKEFVKGLLEYLSLQRIFQRRLSNYLSFDRIMYNTVFSLNGDTINLGDEYVAAVPFCVFNTEHQPILVLNGDTFEVAGGLNIFSEKTTKRGHVKKEGYITHIQFGEEQRIPVRIEYYVK